MKKIVSLIMAVVMIASVCITLVACDEDTVDYDSTYTVDSQFYYSSDAGHTYGNATKEFVVGETVYMKLITTIQSSAEEAEVVKVKLSIPYITSVDAKYYDGQIITPVYDPVQNVTIYEFNVPTNAPADVGTFVFQFVPNSEAEVRLLLEFDDKISSIYDKQNTVKFVAAETNADGE